MADNESAPANLNKASLSDEVASRTGVSRPVAYELVETLFDVIAAKVAQGGSVAITNFGSFSRTDKQARMARNPHTGTTIEVPERKAIKFAVAPRLLEFANSANPSGATIRKNAKRPLDK